MAGKLNHSFHRPSASTLSHPEASPAAVRCANRVIVRATIRQSAVAATGAGPSRILSRCRAFCIVGAVFEL